MDQNKNEEVVEKLIEALGGLTDAIQPLTDEEKKNAEAAKKSAKRLEEVGAQLGVFAKSMGSAAKAMTSADEGTAKYAAGLEGATGAVAGIAGQFGILGKGIGLLVNIFGTLAGGALKQNEALVKTYKGLAEAGDLGNASFRDLATDLQKAGFSVAEGGSKFIGVIKANSEGLAAFGGSVTAGRQKLTSVFSETGALGEFEYTLRRFGYDSEDAFKHTAFWASQLAITGGLKERTDKQVAQSTQSYLVNLAALSDLTGQSRDSMEAKMKQEANDLRYQYYLSKLENSTSEADRQRAANIRLQVASMPEIADGLKSVIVNNGQVVDEFGAKLFMATGQQGIGALINATKTSAKEFPLAMVDSSKLVGSTIKRNLSTLEPTMMASNEAMAAIGFTGNMLAMANRAEATDKEEYARRLAALQDKTAKNDQDLNTRLVKQQRVARNAYEQLELSISDGLIPALSKFQTVVLGMGKKFAQILNKFGGPDLEDLFVDMNNLSEVTEALAKKQKEELVIKEDLQDTLTGNKMLQGLIASLEKEKASKGKAFGSQGALDTYQKSLATGQARATSLQSQLANTQKAVGTLSGTQGNLSNEQAKTELQQAGAKPPVAPAGVTFKGDAGAGMITPELQEKINQLASVLPGARITSMNDADTLADHAASKSKHGKGKALDLTVPEMDKLTEEQKKEVISKLTQMGMKAWFEQSGQKNSNNSTATGNHFHAELGARFGAEFKGPESGYSVQLHGREAVVPMGKFDNFAKQYATNQQQVKKDTLSSSTFKQDYSPTSTSDNISRVIESIVDVLTEKLDDLIYEQRQSKHVQEQLLTVARH